MAAQVKSLSGMGHPQQAVKVTEPGPKGPREFSI